MLLRKKTFRFSLKIIDLIKRLRDKNEYIISNQILRSGTSIDANIYEAEGSQSRKDFISEIKIAFKVKRQMKLNIG